MGRCTEKGKKDNFGPPSTKDKAQNTFHQINMTPMINQKVKQNLMMSSLMNVREPEMDQKKQYFGKFSSLSSWAQTSA